MRPLHAVSLLAVLAALVVALFFVLNSDDGSGHVASAVHDEAPAVANDAVAGAAALEAPASASEADKRAAQTARVASTAQQGKPTEAELKNSGFELTGRIVDARGQPVAAATIYAAGANAPRETPLETLDPKLMPWAKRVDTQSAADGRFRLRSGEKGIARLSVRAAGFAPRDLDLQSAAGARDIGDVVLEESALLSGRVLDKGGRAVADAELRRIDEAPGAIVFMGAPRGVPLCKTDAQGRFKIDQLASGPWKLLITSEDHPDKTEGGQTERPGERVTNLEFVLEEGARIEGRVVDVPAAMLANLFVRASPRPAGEKGNDAGMIVVDTRTTEGPAGLGGSRSARINADGSFVLRGLKPNVGYRLRGREGEREFFGRTRTASVNARAGDRNVLLAYKPETAIVFQLVDAKTRAPVEELYVQAGYRWMMPLLDDDNRSVHNFPGGRVRFGNLPPRPEGESASLRIESAGYAPFELKNLQVLEGQDLDLGVLALERAPLVDVLVENDADGKPVAGALVRLVEETPAAGGRGNMSFTIDEDVGGFGELGSSQRAKTDERGRAALTSLPGKRATLRVTHPEHASYQSETLELPLLEDLQHKVRMHDGGTVVVELFDAKHEPVAGVRIEHKAVDDGAQSFFSGADTDDSTDAQGRVRFGHLPAGVHRFRQGDGRGDEMAFGEASVVRINRRGGEEAPQRGWTEVTVTEGGLETVRLLAPTRSQLTGRITEGGKPLASATVKLNDESDDGLDLPFMGPGAQAKTNGKGEYTIERVKTGSYRASITHPSRAMSYVTNVKIHEDDNELDVDLPITGIEGKITGEGDKPLAGVRVHAERAEPETKGPKKQVMTAVMFTTDGGDAPEMTFSTGEPGGGQTVTTDAEGRYKLRGVLADVDLVVKASGKEVQPGESPVLKLASDQIKTGVDLKLAQGGAIDVELVRADGRPGGSCMVRGRFEGDPAVEPKAEFSGGGGSVKLSGLKPGKWRVTVTPMGPASDDHAAVPDQLIDVVVGKSAKAHFDLP